jgi:hypothetical protein
MEVIRCLEDDEIGRQLKCKICDVGLCIFGIQLCDAGGGSLYIHQADNYKKRYVH